ncbi:MAG: hypothetical protein QM296_04950 [Bacillota bacterium]|nr:hypothetical protein [Bacillota bacterium]
MRNGSDSNGPWYHGSNRLFDELVSGSTVTPWRKLAAAFSHQPDLLSYDDDGAIWHNGTEPGYLYVIAEEIVIGRDIYPHPRTTMDENVEFLTRRPLRLRLIERLAAPPAQP